jgi:hypothetical protein
MQLLHNGKKKEEKRNISLEKMTILLMYDIK